jgi:biotin carboxylase
VPRQRNDLPRLLLADVGLGPQATWYLPRLHADYDVRVVWLAGGSEASESDHARAETFRAWLPDGAHIQVPNYRRMLEQLRAVSAEWSPDGIAALCGDQAVADVHAICHTLGLPGNDPASLPALHNKFAQRTTLRDAGLPVPAFAAVDSYETLVAALEYVGTPAVLKPVAGSGSVATLRLDAATDAGRTWALAAVAAPPGGEYKTTARFILERLIIGQRRHADARYGCQVSVESVVSDGQVLHLAITDKLPLIGFREVADIMPSTLSSAECDELLAETTEALRALAITNSATHTEFMLTGDGPRLIEVNSRFGGGYVQLLHFAYEYDAVSALAAVATGQAVRAPGPPRRFAALLTPQAPSGSGRLTAVPTPEELRRIPQTIWAMVTVSPGDLPDTTAGTKGGALAYLTAVADEPGALIDLAALLASDRYFRFETPGRPSDRHEGHALTRHTGPVRT